MKDPAKSIIFPDKMLIKSKFNIARNYINFENIDIESKNIHAVISGKLSDYFGKVMPTLDLNVRLNKSRVEEIAKILPPFNIEEIDVYYLKKHKFYGNTLANFSIKGRLPEPNIIGDIYIDDGVLTKPIPNTAKGATIKINLTGKHANFDVIVPAGGLEKVSVKGSQDSVDLKIAQNVLIPLHEILNFIIGPVPIMDIQGKGNVDLIVKGNRKNPHIWGVFNIKNGTASFNDIPKLKMTNANAVLKFTDQNVTFTNEKGLVNGKEFSIKGICDVFGKFDFDVFGQNQPTEILYNSILTSKISSFCIVVKFIFYSCNNFRPITSIFLLEYFNAIIPQR